MKLDLELNRSPKRPWVSWVILGIGVALATEMAISYDRLRTELDARVVKSASAGVKTKGQSTAKAMSDDPTLQAEIARAVAAMDDLAKPWETLFEALETIDFERVALLSIQPDATARTLTLTAEAKAYPDLLTYIARLKDKRVFSAVVLTSHELREDDPYRPYVFTTRAQWTIRQ